MKNFFNVTNINLKVIYVINYIFNFQLVFSINFKMEQDLKQFQEFSDSCSHFSSALFQVLTSKQSQENVVSSPLSAHIILLLLFQGADGTTKEELISSLHVLDSDQIQENIQYLLSSLNRVQKTELEMINAMYIDSSFRLLPNFMNIGKDIFKTFIEKVNCTNEVDTSNKINLWIKEKTQGKITNVISSDDIDEETKVILVNTLYFKSAWFNPFEPELTEEKKFHNINRVEIKVPMMHKTFNLPHGHIERFDANFIKMKYLNEDFEMIVILPNELHGLYDLEKKFDWDLISKASCSIKEVELSLPKFRIDASVDLKPALIELGINTIFKEEANFSFMAENPLFVNQVLQKFFVDVNEKGSEAAVATVVQMRSRRMIVDVEYFIVDHPFMFIINYKPSNIPLFIGSIRRLEGPVSKDEL